MKWKNTIESFNSKLKRAEENLWTWRQISWYYPDRGEKNILEWKSVRKAYANYGTPLDKIIFTLWESQKEKRDRKGQKTSLKK